MPKPGWPTVLGAIALGLGLTLAAPGVASADERGGAGDPASPRASAHVKVGARPAAHAPIARSAVNHVAPHRVVAKSANSALPVGPVSDFVNSVMLAVRRLLFNQAPSISAQGSGYRLPNGAVWDYLHGSDPEGDVLRYTLDQAAQYGTVVVNDAGAYTYTPGAEFSGADTFVIGVEDTGLHINLFDLFGNRHSQVAVTVRSSLTESHVVVDEFNGAAGARPYDGLWNYEVGNGVGDGLQTYTDSVDNVRLDGEGHLVIQASPVDGGYTSGLLTTKGKLDMTFGTVTARIKFPAGQGIWPAFWMLGSSFSRATWNATDERGWPGCGEIDVMELASSATTYHVALHGPNVAGGDFYGSAYWRTVGSSGVIADLSAGFHDYWVTRGPDMIVVGIDDTVLGTFTPASLPAGGEWVFNEPMFAILNVAVGGPWPGPPDATTVWPATLLVDSFRYDPAV